MVKLRYAVLLAIVLFIGCGKTPPEGRFKEDLPVENNNMPPVKLEVFHLEQDLFKLTDQNANAQIDTLRKKYGQLFDLYLLRMAQFVRPDDPMLDQKLVAYINDGDIKTCIADVKKTFPDFGPYKTELETGFTRYKYFFPDKKVPRIVTMISGYNVQTSTTVNELCIGLDLYLGRNYPIYPALKFNQYQRVSFQKEYLASNSLYNWCETEFENDSTKTLLDKMIFKGKILFLVDALLPDVSDTIKLRYSQAQITWAQQNEAMIWAHIVDKKLLYSTDGKMIQKYTGEAPFTADLPRESPGRVANFIGLQIVKAYMAKNTSLTLVDLFKNTDAQKLLSESGYRPAAKK